MLSKKMFLLFVLCVFAVPAVYGDLVVFSDYQALHLTYTPTSATAGNIQVRETVGSQFAAYLVSSGTDIDSARMSNTGNALTDFQVEFASTLFSNPAGLDDIAILADVILTDNDHNTLATPSMQAKFQNVGGGGDLDGVSYSLATHTLNIAGIIWTPLGNPSILLNPALGDWTYIGTSQDPALGNGSDGIANQFTVPSSLRDNYDSGTIAVLKLNLPTYKDGTAITATNADDLFAGAFGHGGIDVTGAQLQVSVVPAPFAILLGGIGLALVGWMRKRFA